MYVGVAWVSLNKDDHEHGGFMCEKHLRVKKWVRACGNTF